MKSTKKPQYAKCDYENGEGAEVMSTGHGNKIMPAEAERAAGSSVSPGRKLQPRLAQPGQGSVAKAEPL